MTSDVPAEASGSSGRFHTTRWSLIVSSLDSGTEDEKARDALTQLCRIYWRPIFAFVCRKGYSVPDAQDLTQDFFVMILRGNLLRQAHPERGRFRSLLLKSLQNFLIKAQEKAHSLKRGGGVEFVSWDEWMAESPSRLSIPVMSLDRWPPEKVFDVRWAATVAERAMRRLQEDCNSAGQRQVFDVLSNWLTSEREDVSYEALARDLGMETAAIKRLLHQMRQRYRQLLRAEVAETVEQPADVDDEVRYLAAALAAGQEA
jgi:DNA-directed RNA polymerase specialized sigma24 family protein